MRFEMKMPDLATTDSEIRIVRWLVEPGQEVQRGQPLVEVETDKATMEVESVAGGVLGEVRSRAGDAVSVGDVIAVLEVEGGAPAAAAIAPAPVAKAAPPGAIPPAAPLPDRAAGGPRGMFARNRAAAAGAPAASADSGIPLSLAQRVAARRLQESKQTIPHFYLQTTANVAGVVARRKAAVALPPAWDAFFVLSAARALARFDRFQCRLEGDRLVRAGTEDVGVAVDEAGELYVIPVAAPAAKTLEQVSEEIRRGVERIRAGNPEARRFRRALLTVSNLGVLNVESFIPIINPPEAAILGVGRARPTPVAQADGRIGVETRCTLTLSVDHRVASGRYAGEFLAAIVKELESI
jgi:pyruvate dehydrogenase E2 component (dihydrolipoamide acetyltransferase)